MTKINRREFLKNTSLVALVGLFGLPVLSDEAVEFDGRPTPSAYESLENEKPLSIGGWFYQDDFQKWHFEVIETTSWEDCITDFVGDRRHALCFACDRLDDKQVQSIFQATRSLFGEEPPIENDNTFKSLKDFTVSLPGFVAFWPIKSKQ